MKSVNIIVALVAFVTLVKADNVTQSYFDTTCAETREIIKAGGKKFDELAEVKSEYNHTKVQSFLITELADNKRKIEETFKILENNAKPLGENFQKSVDALSKQFIKEVKELHSPDNQQSVLKLKESFIKTFTCVLDKITNTRESFKSTSDPQNVQVGENMDNLASIMKNSAIIVRDKIQEIINKTQNKTA